MRHADRSPDVAEPREGAAEPVRGDDQADDDEARSGQGTPDAQGPGEEGRPGRALRHRLPRLAVRAQFNNTFFERMLQDDHSARRLDSVDSKLGVPSWIPAALPVLPDLHLPWQNWAESE